MTYSVSDVRLVFLLSTKQSATASSVTDYGRESGSVSIAPQHDASAISNSNCPAITAASDPEEVLHIPAHKLMLMAKSGYFSTRLSTSLGEVPTTVIREHAESWEEVSAMENVLEFMYTDNPSDACTSDTKPLREGEAASSGGHFYSKSIVQRLLLVLQVSFGACVLSGLWSATPC